MKYTKNGERKKREKKRKENASENKKAKRSACSALAGTLTHIHNSKLHTRWSIRWDTRHTHPNLDNMIINLKPAPAQGRLELWRTVQFQYIYILYKYLNTYSIGAKNINIKNRMGKEENVKGKRNKEETIAGARTRVLKLKVAPKLFGPAACVFFSGEKKASHYVHTAHARVTHGTQRSQLS